MSWNHRVIKTGDDSFAMHEVYYDDDGKPEYWTTLPVPPAAESLSALGEVLGWMKDALDAPVLEEYVAENGEDKLREVA